jgi:glycosyltransferase involved in cell wall biosynthesis
MIFYNKLRAFERSWLRALFHFFSNGLERNRDAATPESLLAWNQTRVEQAGRSTDLPRIAMVSPAPPATTGIATFAANYFKSPAWNLDFYAPGSLADLERFQGSLPEACVLPVETLGARVPLDAYDAILLQTGNSAHHVDTLDAWVRRIRPAAGIRVLYLHDAQLVRLWAAWCEGNPWRLSRLYKAYYPDRAFGVMDLFTPQESDSLVPRGLRPLLDMARPDLVLVNSASCAELANRDLEGWDGPVPRFRQLFHPVPDRPLPAAQVDPGARRIGHFGTLGNGKNFSVMFEAVRRLQAKAPTTLVLAGFNAGRFAKRRRLDRVPWVEVHDSPSDSRLLELMDSVNVGIQLRYPTQGESSGVVNQLLSMGKPVLVNRTGSFAELGDAVVAVSPCAEPQEVAEALEVALTNPPSDAIQDLAARLGLKAFHAAILGVIQEAAVHP